MTCSYKPNDYEKIRKNYSCIQSVWDGDEEGLCIFHSHKTEQKAEKFRSDLDTYIKLIKLENEVQEYDFIGFVWPSASFSDYHFTKVVDFSEGHFYGKSNFRLAVFEDFASFRFCIFEGETSFERAQFKEASFFNSSVFKESASFSTSHFHTIARFLQVQFNILILRGVVLDHGVMFEICKIAQLLYTTHLGQRITFNSVDIPEHGNWDFQDQNCCQLSFVNCDLSRANFIGADIRDTRFDSCTWDKAETYVQVYDHNRIIKQNKPAELEKLRSLYLRLKKNHDEDHEFALSGDFHYQEMELKRRLKLEEVDFRPSQDWFFSLVGACKKLKNWKPLSERWLLWLYKFTADYGESPLRLLRSLIGSLAIAPLFIYWANSLTAVADTHKSVKLMQIYEIVTFGLMPSSLTTEAKGLVSGLNFGAKLIVFGEAVFTITITTLLVMAIRRRFKR